MTIATPEFLAWAIEHTCPIRGGQDGSDPERTERQLRAARAYSDARSEGRVFEGLCVAPPDGFRVDEALKVYGGRLAVEQACGGCSANVLAHKDESSLAGCYGLLPLPDDRQGFYADVDQAIARSTAPAEMAEHFAVTSPRWHGLWIETPIRGNRARLLVAILADVRFGHADGRRAANQFLAALDAVARTTGTVHVRLYPPGRVEGPWWRLMPHCPRCKATCSESALSCTTCGYHGRPAPAQKRHARGQRPYAPLSRLLGEQAAAEFAARYAAIAGRT